MSKSTSTTDGGGAPPGIAKAVGFVSRVLRQYGRHDGPLLAAAIAYYGLFSLFPFLLFALAVLTVFISIAQLEQQLMAVVSIYLPAPDTVEFIRRNFQHVVNARSKVGIIALAATLWGASTIFFVISRALNRIFGSETNSSLVRHRLIAMVVVITLGFLLLMSIVTSTYFRVISVGIGLQDYLPEKGDQLWKVGASLLPLLFTITLFMVAYRCIPASTAAWEAVLVGAVTSGIGFELLKTGFRVYLERLSPYSLVYGSVTTVVVLLFWIYIGAAVFLLGAEVAAEVRRGLEDGIT
jgi:membrane protein